MWYLYTVHSPSGTLVDHNYVTVAICSSFEATENPFPNELLVKIVPAQSAAEFMKKTLASRDLVRSELWRTITTTPEGPLAKPARFLNVQYMKVPTGGDAAYLEIEKLWKKMHDVRIKEGTLANWGVYSRILPGGSDYPYNYATADGYSHYKDIFGLDFPTVLQKASSGNERQRAGRADREGQGPGAGRGLGAYRLRSSPSEIEEARTEGAERGTDPGHRRAQVVPSTVRCPRTARIISHTFGLDRC